ncbi:D-alanyl-D-alanine carboxypeptidase [bacterium]|nr:D-alanyl-D-alanine carboxypeptidase [bacterium]
MSKRFLLNCFLVVLIALVWWSVGIKRSGRVLFLGSNYTKDELELYDLPAVPMPMAGAATASAILSEKLHAQGAIIIDRASKKVLFQKNSGQLFYPASTTKILTALVARELYDLDEKITLTAQDLAYDNVVGWQVGDQISVRDALKSLLIVSANEMGNTLANHAPGGYETFVQAMNEKVTNLRLTGSHFINPQGYDAQRQQTTPFDLAVAALELLRDPVLAEIVATAQTDIVTAGGKMYHLRNTNTLLSRDDLGFRVKGIKTGTTDLASEALVSLVEKDGHELVMVVLLTKNRYNDTIELANFAWNNYIWQQATLTNLL